MYIVELTPEAYKALSEYLATIPSLIVAWRDAHMVFGENQETPSVMRLSCDEEQVEALLCLATLHYPAALPMMQKALDRS